MEKLLYVCGAKGSYTRNEVMRRMLRTLEADYHEIVSERGSYPARILDVVARWLGWRAVGGRAKVSVLGFMAQPLAPFAGRGPVVADFFLSVHDTLCLDRKTFAPDGWIGRFLFAMDRRCLDRAELALTDTDENADFYAELFGVPRSKFCALPVSADPDRFAAAKPRASAGAVEVVYYCTFLPLHGAEVVYEAARLLKDEPNIRFTIVGRGKTSAELDRRLKDWKLPNVRRLEWVPYDELAAALEACDICLAGHFSKNAKAMRVVPGKAYQFLAMGKPVILGDNPANRRLFRDAEDGLFCALESPESLAAAIRRLAGDEKLRREVGRRGRERFERDFHPDRLAERLKTALARVTSPRPK